MSIARDGEGWPTAPTDRGRPRRSASGPCEAYVAPLIRHVSQIDCDSAVLVRENGVVTEDREPARDLPHPDSLGQEPARLDDPDEETMRHAIERFRRAIEHASPCCDEAVQAHEEASAARARWFPRLADRIAEAAQAYDERRDAFATLSGRGEHEAGLVPAAEALDQAQKQLGGLIRLRDNALRGESTRASMIESARRVEEAARSREWHRGDSEALPPPDDWRDVG